MKHLKLMPICDAMNYIDAKIVMIIMVIKNYFMSQRNKWKKKKRIKNSNGK